MSLVRAVELFGRVKGFRPAFPVVVITGGMVGDDLNIEEVGVEPLVGKPLGLKTIAAGMLRSFRT